MPRTISLSERACNSDQVIVSSLRLQETRSCHGRLLEVKTSGVLARFPANSTLLGNGPVIMTSHPTRIMASCMPSSPLSPQHRVYLLERYKPTGYYQTQLPATPSPDASYDSYYDGQDVKGLLLRGHLAWN
jgi:hypothetical protein